jgi:hypothetical protein
VRKTDGRLLFPFDGAEAIGPFETSDEARRAANARGQQIVASDIERPEV